MDELAFERHHGPLRDGVVQDRSAKTLGDGWLKMLRLEDYAARKACRPEMPQQALFPYHEAWG